MRKREFLIALVLVLSFIGLRFPGVAEMLPVNTLSVDTEAKNAEELEAIIASAVRESMENIRVRVVSYDEKTCDMAGIISKVLRENAELGFVSGCSTSIKRRSGSSVAVLELTLQYYYPKEKVIAMREEVELKAEEISGMLIKPGMSEYDKVMAVHDYVIRNSTYDRANADKGTVPQEGHEAYGVIVDGIGVCDSYAKAVKLLLDKAGVQCRIVEGTAVGNHGYSEEHAWNIVSIEGEYYHIDATWDDVSEEKGSSDIVYHYLNLSDGELQKSHTWDRDMHPQCSGTKYNYHVYNGLCADGYNEVVSRLAKAVSGREKKLSVKITDYNAEEYNVEKMVRQAAKKSKLRNGISAKWVINDTLGLLDIEFEY